MQRRLDQVERAQKAAGRPVATSQGLQAGRQALCGPEMRLSQSSRKRSIRARPVAGSPRSRQRSANPTRRRTRSPSIRPPSSR
jgi:hypothetical protein